jgi:hypothetical protein
MNENSLLPDVREHSSRYDASLPAHACVDWGASCPISGERKPLNRLMLHTKNPIAVLGALST